MIVESNTYLGGVIGREHAVCSSGATILSEELPLDRGGSDNISFLEAREDLLTTFPSGDVSILVRGYALPQGAEGGPPPNHDVAASLWEHYRQAGHLSVEGWDGSFTIALVDRKAGRVILYRNLVGNGFTYYCETPYGFLFSSNLAELVHRLPTSPEPNETALPTFFVYRAVPGRETLFKGIYRLMPGEQVIYDSDGLRRSQRVTFADLMASRPIEDDALERTEDTMRRILADCAALRPEAGNLLSGGVDSSYIQAHWNQAVKQRGRVPVSFCVAIDHPRTRPDMEYAVTAAEALGVRHTLVSARPDYADSLLETIASLGEPPNHVQSAYFLELAREMVAAGHSTGLCGEGADSFFGVGEVTCLQTAQILRRVVPFRTLQYFGELAALRLGRPGLQQAFQLASRIDDFADTGHPINHVAVFTDRASVQACFGENSVAEALAYRRRLLDQYCVPNDAVQRLHAAGFLGEGMDTASLWTTLFNAAGGDLLCPFLDSRLLRLALNLSPKQRFPFRRPKGLLKRALVRYLPAELVYRQKLGFGQPIFEWMAPGGQLRPMIEQIDSYPFLKRDVFKRALERPNWFLFSLLCYDLWHKTFITKTLACPVQEELDGSACQA